MKPYTYLIKHKPTNKVYYGVRCANKLPANKDLWVKYFTSSPIIRKLIAENGKESFDVQVRKIFETKEKAVKWEAKVLKKFVRNEKFLNQNVMGYVIPTPESNAKISEYHMGKPKTEEHKKKLSESQKGSKRPWTNANLPKDVKGEKNPMYGRKHSPETIAKMKASLARRRAMK